VAEQSKESVPVKREESRPLGSSWDLTSLRDEVDRLFDEFGSAWPFRRRSALEPLRGLPRIIGANAPAVDVIDEDTQVLVKAELPGLSEDDVEVKVSDGALTISGEKKEEREEGEKGGRYYLSERRYGSFERTFRLPEGISREDITAKFKKGVLTVTLPKTPEALEKTKKIKVKGE
jgi:HSP20 family protein